ncbi:hypothetical protein BGZ61DRAFT_481620 [Ilyonectria robusta]|uniref:uncharacterized protein n=1 Tax=Ilyonectria robusta TaxID=1079257 RepID=UPI001E8E4513|nr:uncharacterized protein BGZ61DRAFT_481620 [Ilyonectria robusta]KAH8677001.1 hypothetical protein BGZ61DRAFT_481620 [Ilyonectria robusta]
MDQSLQTLGPSSIQPALQRSPRHVRHNRRYRVHAVWTVQVESKQETPTAEPLFGENDEGWSEPRVSTRTMTRTQRPGQSETMTRLHGGAPRGDWRRALEQGRRDVAQAARCYVCGHLGGNRGFWAEAEERQCSDDGTFPCLVKAVGAS